MTRPFVPYGRTDVQLMWRVLSSWQRMSTARPDSDILQLVLSEFPTVDPKTLAISASKAPLPLSLENWGWIVGSPLPRSTYQIVPVATVHLSGDTERVTEAAFRVALLGDHQKAGIVSFGWRFESPETDKSPSSDDPAPGPSPHPYGHAQAIVGWTRSHDCLLHPSHNDDEYCAGIDPSGSTELDAERIDAFSRVLVKHPAFPMPARTLAGLALAMIATLYGVSDARRIVERESDLERVGGALLEDLGYLGLLQ